MRPDHVLSIDLGTTGNRAIVYDGRGGVAGSAYKEFRQYYPKPGWVEHDALEIWRSTLEVIRLALSRAGVASGRIAAIGIANQRETTVLWDKETGKPVGRAIVWQDRRTSGFCHRLKTRGLEKTFRRKTGLVLDPYFSGTKIRWMLDRDPRLRKKARTGRVLFGTIDAWILWNLTKGRAHATDITNASRTLLLNIKTGRWDRELTSLLGVPGAMLPEVRRSGGSFGETAAVGALRNGIPILAMMGDQQAALYGQGCHARGEAKNTYGTGCFVVVNLGSEFSPPPPGLLATVACDRDGGKTFAFEGSIFVAGAAIQWLRDGLGFFKKAAETDAMARGLADSGGVTVIPALTGLGAPHWAPEARGMITGLTRGATRAHIVRATLESIAQQTADVLEVIGTSTGFKVPDLKTDGGATANRFLMQFQADLLGIPVKVSDIAESTAWGAAKLAARTAGLWKNLKESGRGYRTYKPKLARAKAAALRCVWKREMSRLLSC